MTSRRSTWRDTYKVHPAADVFPMMSDEELKELGEDIKANGLKTPIIFQDTGNPDELILIDGRNRLEAMERAGIIGGYFDKHYRTGDPVAHIIGLNILRRHLTKEQRADLIVAALKATEKPRTDCAVSAEPHHGGRGKVNAVKQRAITEGKKYDIGQRTMEKALAKATPKPKAVNRSERGHTIMRRPLRSKSGPGYSALGIDAARQHYSRHAQLLEDLDAEMKTILDALREIAAKRAMQAQADDDLGDIPESLDRRRQGGTP